MIIGHTFQPVCQQKNSNFLQKKGSTFFVFPSKMPFLNLMTLGLYMFLADDLVLAHSAIENGVNRLDVSMCTFKEPVSFLNGKKAKIIIVLCAEDKTKHIHVLNDVLNIFSKKKSIDQITSLSTPAEIYAYIDKHIEK